LSAGLKSIAAQTAATGASMARSLTAPFKAGAAAAKASLVSMGSSMKDGFKNAATMGGALSAGILVKSAVELSDTFGDIAFQINKAKGTALDWRDVQAMIAPAADATGQKIEKMTGAFQSMFAATGDLEMAKEAMIPVGQAAMVTGKDIDTFSNIAQLAFRKFNVGAKDMGDAMAVAVQLTDAGGLSAEEMTNKFALMAGEASEAGFKGSEGFGQVLATLVRLDARIGEKSVPGLKMIFQQFKEGSGALKTLSKESNIKFKTDTSALDKMQELLKTGKGRKSIEAKLTGDARAVFDELVKPFDDAVANAKKSGANTKDATAAGLDAFQKAMKAAGKTTMDAASLQAAAKDAIKDPAEQMNIAINRMKMAFTQPEMVDAITQLAASLPKFAKGLAKVIDVVVKNPMLAGAMFVGGRSALSFAGGAGSNLAVSGVKGLGTKIGAEFAVAAAASGKWAAAGKMIGAAGGIAIAAVIAYELGKAGIDKELDKEFSNRASAEDVLSSSESLLKHGGSREKKEAALKALRVQQEKLKEGPGAVASTLGALAHVASGGEVKSAGEVNMDQQAKVASQIKQLTDSLKAPGDAGKKAAFNMEQFANSAVRAKQTLDAIALMKPPGGPIDAPPAGSGSAPVPGSR